ncbi:MULTISPECIES: hypothetical protein [Dickeya]|nr:MULTISPECIES: hypothetical protein [Dickeya]
MTSPLSFNRSATGIAVQNTRADSDSRPAPASTDTETSEPPSLTSVMVQFSNEVRKQFDAAMRANMNQLNNARQDLARSRVEQIKQRIQMLKMMVMSLAGQSVPPGLLSEIRQLARELGQAAKTLSEGSGSGAAGGGVAGMSGGENASGVMQGATSAQAGATAPGASASAESGSEGEQAADTASAAKGEGDALAQAAEQLQNIVAAFTERDNGSSQHRADAKSVQEAVRELKSLVAMVKNASKHGDQQAHKTIQEIDRAIADTEKTVQSMDMTAGGADIRVDAAAGSVGHVSIDVQV